MTKIRITKEFRFEMAHALLGYDGKCSNIHGHSYVLSVSLIGAPIKRSADPKNGMVMDFGDLKKIVYKEIIEKFDHAMLLNEATPDKNKLTAFPLFKKVVFVSYQPTCENMLADFAARIKKDLPKNIKLFSLRLRETSDSFAEWFAEDNGL
jgi:6-pyruvoyltetrahydropterin/6-carboxytetrahydropterin synthase